MILVIPVMSGLGKGDGLPIIISRPSPLSGLKQMYFHPDAQETRRSMFFVLAMLAVLADLVNVAHASARLDCAGISLQMGVWGALGILHAVGAWAAYSNLHQLRKRAIAYAVFLAAALMGLGILGGTMYARMAQPVADFVLGNGGAWFC